MSDPKPTKVETRTSDYKGRLCERCVRLCNRCSLDLTDEPLGYCLGCGSPEFRWETDEEYERWLRTLPPFYQQFDRKRR